MVSPVLEVTSVSISILDPIQIDESIVVKVGGVISSVTSNEFSAIQPCKPELASVIITLYVPPVVTSIVAELLLGIATSSLYHA